MCVTRFYVYTCTESNIYIHDSSCDGKSSKDHNNFSFHSSGIYDFALRLTFASRPILSLLFRR